MKVKKIVKQTFAVGDFDLVCQLDKLFFLNKDVKTNLDWKHANSNAKGINRGN